MEARRKFEWIVPEHLPSSPLCPLHPKYQGGYSKGMCYWHPKKRSTSGSRSRPSMERGGAYVGHVKSEKPRDQGGRGEKEGKARTEAKKWSIEDFDSAPRDAGKARKRRLQSFSSP
jgi:hypothetical protein